MIAYSPEKAPKRHEKPQRVQKPDGNHKSPKQGKMEAATDSKTAHNDIIMTGKRGNPRKPPRKAHTKELHEMKRQFQRGGKATETAHKMEVVPMQETIPGRRARSKATGNGSGQGLQIQLLCKLNRSPGGEEKNFSLSRFSPLNLFCGFFPDPENLDQKNLVRDFLKMKKELKT